LLLLLLLLLLLHLQALSMLRTRPLTGWCVLTQSWLTTA
jgi:hypothetical protein